MQTVSKLLWASLLSLGGTVQAGDGLAAKAAETNPKVQPGLVRWHADYAAACAAGKESGKPVLLFQMMGRLDQQFC
jgi:hypothetical protein